MFSQKDVISREQLQTDGGNVPKEPLSAQIPVDNKVTIRVCKSDAKGGQSFFTYESPEDAKTASRYIQDDSLPFFGGQNEFKQN